MLPKFNLELVKNLKSINDMNSPSFLNNNCEIDLVTITNQKMVLPWMLQTLCFHLNLFDLEQSTRLIQLISSLLVNINKSNSSRLSQLLVTLKSRVMAIFTLIKTIRPFETNIWTT